MLSIKYFKISFKKCSKCLFLPKKKKEGKRENIVMALRYKKFNN